MSFDRTPDSTAQDAFAITPSDSTRQPCKAIYVGTAGNVAVLTAEGNSVVFVGAVAGTVLPVRADKILSTNTTASNLVGLL